MDMFNRAAGLTDDIMHDTSSARPLRQTVSSCDHVQPSAESHFHVPVVITGSFRYGDHAYTGSLCSSPINVCRNVCILYQ